MFNVVEFCENAGGGLGVVHESWLTPRKRETFWPNFKNSSQFSKALTAGMPPNDEWAIHKINKIYYSTDDILKARQKEREAQYSSDVVSDTSVTKRKRIRSHLLDSSDEDEPRVVDKFCDRPCPPPPQYHITDSVFTNKASDIGNVSEASASSPKVSKEKILESKTLDVIARHLARLEKKVDEIYDMQVDLLKRINPGNSRIQAAELAIPENVRIPFKTKDDVEELENWLSLNKDNETILEGRKL